MNIFINFSNSFYKSSQIINYLKNSRFYHELIKFFVEKFHSRLLIQFSSFFILIKANLYFFILNIADDSFDNDYEKRKLL